MEPARPLPTRRAPALLILLALFVFAASVLASLGCRRNFTPEQLKARQEKIAYKQRLREEKLRQQGFAQTQAAKTADGRFIFYNRFNIHTAEIGGKRHATYLGFVEPRAPHTVIPPNTPMHVGDWPQGFLLHIIAERRDVFFEYDQTRMGMPKDDYLAILTAPAPEPVPEETAQDREGVRQGRALPGMSKNGVLTALGYPPKNLTPDLDADVWTYAKNRESDLVVDFTEDGLVARVKR